MAIRTVVTRGYGNGTFNGTIGLVVTHGYSISGAGSPVTGPLSLTLATSGRTSATPASDGSAALTLASDGRTLADV